jgi:hypothetical protein
VKDWWNLLDCVIVFTSIALTIIAIIPDIQSIKYLQVSAVLRLFRLFFTFRKTNEYRRIHRKLRRTSASQDFAVETAYERILDLLGLFMLEPWVKSNPALMNELAWCMEAISSNSLYEAVLTIKRESQTLRQADLVSLVKIYSATPRPESRAPGPPHHANTLSPEKDQLIDLKSDLSDSVLACLSEVDSCTFDIFALKEVTEDNELLTLMHSLFARADLYTSAGINASNFDKFARAVQAGYHSENPYHNSTHAADVLQALHYFLGPCGVDNYLSLSPLELAGSYIAAAIHDYDHPGVNNGYLINTQTDLAIRYNDRSVLENHHVASAFALTHEADNDPFEDLRREDYRRIRELIIEMVLSTDIAQHFSLLTKFRAKYVDSLSAKADDKLLVMSLLLHAADISNPGRPWKLCEKWVNLVMQEFWSQGDKERSRGLTVTYMMDREGANIGKSQVGFIDVIVSPVFQSFKEVLPKFEACCHALQANKDHWAARVREEEDETKDPGA